MAYVVMVVFGALGVGSFKMTSKDHQGILSTGFAMSLKEIL